MVVESRWGRCFSYRKKQPVKWLVWAKSEHVIVDKFEEWGIRWEGVSPSNTDLKLMHLRLISHPDWHWYQLGNFQSLVYLNSLYRWGNTLTVWDHFSSGRRLVGNDTCLYWISIAGFFPKFIWQHCLASQTTHSLESSYQHSCARCCLEEEGIKWLIVYCCAWCP